jgi:hypothetical protein
MGQPGRRERIRIGEIRAVRSAGAWRIIADVDGRATWFESAEVDLEPVAEAYGSAFLIPALHRHAVLELDPAVDPVWLGNVPAILELLHGWWELPERVPRARTRPPGAVRDGSERALFFSGGVDSFFTLLCAGERVDRLVLVHGFDYGREDRPRFEATERTVREVAEARGIRWTTIRTDAREHPLYEDVAWERAHGGVLAAVGHLLGDDIGELLVSSSVPRVTPIPWGSHWLLDPLWSSSRKRFVHVGHDHRKEDKLRAIANEPLAHRYLRVCWENRSASGNCSRCYKCLYARLVLAEIGALERFGSLEGMDTLAASVEALPRGRGQMRTFTALMESPRLPADVRRAIADLVARTLRERRPIVRLRRAAADVVFRLLPRRGK